MLQLVQVRLLVLLHYQLVLLLEQLVPLQLVQVLAQFLSRLLGLVVQ
jgi:hypothetical protein